MRYFKVGILLIVGTIVAGFADCSHVGPVFKYELNSCEVLNLEQLLIDEVTIVRKDSIGACRESLLTRQTPEGVGGGLYTYIYQSKKNLCDLTIGGMVFGGSTWVSDKDKNIQITNYLKAADVVVTALTKKGVKFKNNTPNLKSYITSESDLASYCE